MATIGNLKVLLTGDTAGLEKSLAHAERSALRTARKMEHAGRNMSMAITAPILALGTAAVAAFSKQEDAITGLNAALRAHGADVAALSPSYQSFAADIQKVTRYGDEAVLGLMAQQLNLGVTTDKLEDTTRGAIGLAAALKMDLSTASRYAALALGGEFTMLQRYVPALRLATTTAEKMAIVQKLMAGGFEQAKEQARNGTGALAQMKNAVGDAAEAIGKVLMPHVAAAARHVKSWAEELQGLNPETIKTGVVIAGVAAAIGPLLIVGAKTLAMFAKLRTAARTLAGKMFEVNKAAGDGTIQLTKLGKAGAVAAAAFVGWELGRWIAQLKIGGDTIENHISKGLVNAFGTTADITDELDKQTKSLRAQREASERTAKVHEEIARHVANQITQEHKLAAEAKKVADEAERQARAKQAALDVSIAAAKADQSRTMQEIAFRKGGLDDKIAIMEERKRQLENRAAGADAVERINLETQAALLQEQLDELIHQRIKEHGDKVFENAGEAANGARDMLDMADAVAVAAQSIPLDKLSEKHLTMLERLGGIVQKFGLDKFKLQIGIAIPKFYRRDVTVLDLLFETIANWAPKLKAVAINVAINIPRKLLNREVAAMGKLFESLTKIPDPIMKAGGIVLDFRLSKITAQQSKLWADVLKNVPQNGVNLQLNGDPAAKPKDAQRDKHDQTVVTLLERIAVATERGMAVFANG